MADGNKTHSVIPYRNLYVCEHVFEIPMKNGIKSSLKISIVLCL